MSARAQKALKGPLFSILLTISTILVTEVVFSSPFANEPFTEDLIVETISQERDIRVPDLGPHKAKALFRYMTYPRDNFDTNKHTLVMLPGGPGLAASSTFKDSISMNAQYVFIDPRGTGLNTALGKNHPEQLGSKVTVEDTIAVIQSLGLTNYSIWGESYGTVTATILTRALEQRDNIEFKPKSLILEGTFSKAINLDQDSLYIGYDRRFKDFYGQLPQESFDLLKELYRSQTDHKDLNEQLDNLFLNGVHQLRSDRYAVFNDEIRSYLYYLKYDNRDYYGEMQQEIADLMDESPVKTSMELNVWITCKELVSASTPMGIERFSSFYTHFRFTPACQPSPQTLGTYNSSNYQITKTPVIYLQGFLDYQTPYAEALDHKFGQKNLHQDSIFLLIMETNHSVFSNNFTGCLDSFTADIAEGNYALARTRACAEENKVEIKDL